MISRVWVSINLFPGAGSLHWACTLWLLGNCCELCSFIPFFRARDQTSPNLFNGLFIGSVVRKHPGTMNKRIRDPPMDVKCVVVGEAAEVTRLKTGCLWWVQEWWTQLPTWYTPPPQSTLHHLLSCLIYFNSCHRSLTVDTLAVFKCSFRVKPYQHHHHWSPASARGRND